MAFESAFGFAAIDEGDDRVQPGVSLHLGLTDAYQARLHYWGRVYGPVSTDSVVVAGMRRFGLFKSSQLTGGVGLAGLNERITLAFDSQDESEVGAGRSRAEDNYNLGLAFSLGWQLPKSTYPLFLGLSWDSYVFPAGINGGLFLSTGRKQAISVTFGFGV